MACSVELGSSSEGENGRAHFAYSDSCFFGCAVDHPILAGSEVRVSVTGNLPELTPLAHADALSSIAIERSYSCCTHSSHESSCSTSSKEQSCPAGASKELSQTLVVRTRAAGDVHVTFVDAASGDYVDSFTFSVRAPASATLHRTDDDTPIDRLSLHVGDDRALHVDLFDETGAKLEAPNAVRFSADDKTVASFDDPSWFGGDPDGLPSFDLESSWFSVPRLRARHAGVTKLRVRAGAFEKTIDVEVK